MDYRSLAEDVLATARRLGADAADVLIAEGTDFSVTVRLGDVETLEDAGSKALGLRVFIGQRTANAYTSDFSRQALVRLVEEAVEMARASGEDAAAGLPEEFASDPALDLGLHDPQLLALPTPERIERARRAEAAARGASPLIVNSQGSTFGIGEDHILLANTRGFMGSYRATSASLSVVPVGQKDGQMERDYWYTSARQLDDLLAPEEVGRIAAERTLRRLGARQVATAELPVVFDPEMSASLLGDLFEGLSGYSVFRNATFLKDRLGQQVASPLLTIVDDGRRPRGLGARPFDGEGCATRRNVPLERGVLRCFLCDSYAARKIGARPTGSASRGVSGGPGVGPGDLYIEAGALAPEEIVGSVEDGLYVTDLIGFGADLVSGDYSQGAAGHWIRNGKLAYPVHEITIAGNLADMLVDIDAVGNDLAFRGSTSAPTLRVRKMTISGS
jgi:PmbA protein